jgi:hypothetical protein
MFCVPGIIFGGTEGVRSRFLFFAPDLAFGGTVGIGSHFHVFRSRTCFQRYRGRQVPFSCFALPDSLSAVPGALCPVIMFCATVLIFGGTMGVGSRFHILRDRNHFRRYRGRRVPSSFFSISKPLSAVPWASGPIFMFSAPGHVLGVTEGVVSRFLVLRSLTRFRQ